MQFGLTIGAMRSYPLLLLCLLWSLVEVHSQTEYPYVSFIGGSQIALPNHTYVNLSLVAGNGSHSVRCHTDLSTCCRGSEGIHRGDWIPPGSEESLPLPSDTSADIYQVQGDRRVTLRRRNNADMPSGIYHCDIATIAVHDDNDTSVRESVYVGLYATGGNCHNIVTMINKRLPFGSARSGLYYTFCHAINTIIIV